MKHKLAVLLVTMGLRCIALGAWLTTELDWRYSRRWVCNMYILGLSNLPGFNLSLGQIIGTHNLTEQQAADLLNVSKQYLCKLLDTNQLAFQSHDGGMRGVNVEDLLKYKQEVSDKQKAALAEMTQMSQDAGGYDTPAQN